MPTYEATFEIEARTDAYAVRTILERTHDAVREESGSIRDRADDSEDPVRAFEELHEAAKQPTPGTLTITYEQHEGGFDE